MSKIASIQYMPNGNILESHVGWCLVENKEVNLACEYGAIGSLYRCSHCGVLYERAADSRHVFIPSEPLLEKLRGSC